MLSCKKATELIEKKDLAGLDPIQNMQLSLHLMMCKACKDYEKQSLFLDEIISMQMKKNSRLHEKDNQLDEEFKKKICEMIIDKQKKSR